MRRCSGSGSSIRMREDVLVCPQLCIVTVELLDEACPTAYPVRQVFYEPGVPQLLPGRSEWVAYSSQQPFGEFEFLQGGLERCMSTMEREII